MKVARRLLEQCNGADNILGCSATPQVGGSYGLATSTEIRVINRQRPAREVLRSYASWRSCALDSSEPHTLIVCDLRVRWLEPYLCVSSPLRWRSETGASSAAPTPIIVDSRPTNRSQQQLSHPLTILDTRQTNHHL